MTRPVWRLIAVAAVGAALVLIGATDASAHANLRSSDPTAGATLPEAPPTITLTFTEEPEPTLAAIRILDATGAEVDTGDVEPVVGDPHTLRVPLRSMPDGVYTVTWRVVSRTDGHATAGSFAFGVGEAPVGRPALESGGQTNPPPSPLEVAGRWGLLVGLVVALGGAVAILVVFRGRRPAVALLVMAGSAAALVGLIGLALAQRSSAGVGFGALARTAVGRGLLWRALGVGVLAVGAVVLLRVKGWVWAGAAAVVVAAASGSVLAEVSAGHAAGAETFRWAKIGAQWLHFEGVAVWIGGLAALLIGIRGAPSGDKAVAVKRFSTMALFALLMIGATGVFRAWNEVGSPGRLVSTSYGLVVLAKVALLVVLVGLGAINRYRNVPVAPTKLGGLRRISRAELSVAAVALAATALLTSLSPPAPAAATAGGPANSVVATGSDFATSVRVRLGVQPGVAGTNRFRATVRDFDTGDPIQAERLSLRFSFRGLQPVGRSTLDLEPAGRGAFAGTGANLSLEGVWTVTVLIQRGADSLEVPLQVSTACRVEVLSPGPPPIYVSKVAGGATAQVYVDPGTEGPNEVHFTYFDPAGNELPISDLPTATGWGPDGRPVRLDVRRFSPGHFVAAAVLGTGKWRFDATASGADGTLSVCFEETISR